MSIALPASLDTAEAVRLRAALARAIAAGGPIALDGAAVVQAGLACLQVLEAARRAAAAAGLAFAIEGASAALREAGTLAGLAPGMKGAMP